MASDRPDPATCGMISPMSRGWHSRARHMSLMRLLSIGTAGCLVLTGCVSGGGGGDGKKTTSPSSTASPQGTVSPSQRPAIQSRTFLDSYAHPLRVDILSLARLGNDKLKLEIRLTDPNQYDVPLSGLFGDDTYSSVAIVDGENMKAYFPLTSAQSNVLQSGYPSDSNIGTGDSINSSIFFPAPPAGSTKVDIAMPATPMFTDIPIQGTTQVAKGEPDPNRVQLKPPRIEDLTSISDDLNGNQSIDQNGNGEAIRLNTDVLFALNKAKLSNKAKGILKDVAQKIDQAKSTTIKVDGYTDNSGNDAINNPLSKRRAQAVADELKKLVTRSGVTYQTEGHGSADPVASNKSTAGRQKNRRVTVTIGK